MQRSIAVIGASADRSKYGNKAVRAYRRIGYAVYPVNPREAEIEGIPAYRDLPAIPGRIDRVALYVPPAVGITLLEQIAQRQPVELFVNPGTESPELLRRARELGLEPIERCAIRAVGIDPASLDDPSDEP